jgi:hypothetical protein
MNAPVPASIPVIAIQQSGLWKMEQPDFMVNPYDVIDEVSLFGIMEKIRSSSVLIIESDVFRGCEITLHAFLRQIRRRKGKEPRILILRCKILGRENTILTDGDREAGANDVLWYQLSMKQKELTDRIGAFIRGGSLSPIKEPPRKPSVTTDTPAIPRDPKVRPARTPSKRNIEATSTPIQQKQIIPPPIPKNDFPFWLSRPGMKRPLDNKKPSEGTIADSTLDVPSIDPVGIDGEHLAIHLLGHTLIFQKRCFAERFSHIAKNGSATTPYSVISQTKAGALVQLSKLRAFLSTLRPELGKCIVSDPGIGAHFNSNIFLARMNRRNW